MFCRFSYIKIVEDPNQIEIQCYNLYPIKLSQTVVRRRILFLN